MKRLIVTADDFGLAPEVNDAIEEAHHGGILSAASLMMGEAATEDAVSRAKRMPRLHVGLHLTLVEGRPVAPVAEIPDLVDEAGKLRTDLARYGLAIATRPSVRKQLRREIRAQFEAYRATGLPLDHVNAHQHYHLHPAVLSDILSIGRNYNAKAIRVPLEPLAMLQAVENTRRSAAAYLAHPWALLMRQRIRMAGLASADRTFGLTWTGGMTEKRLAGLISRLDGGVSEIYLHPATRDAFPGSAPNYQYQNELSALLAATAKEALARSGAALSGYCDITHGSGADFASRTQRRDLADRRLEPVAIAAALRGSSRVAPRTGHE